MAKDYEKVFQMIKPKVAILVVDGINCDQETVVAFQLAGGNPQKVHLNQLLQKKISLDDFQILVIPGGFSYGDDILSAKVFANQLLCRLRERIEKFIAEKKLVMGICNGFQVLLRMGILPWKMQPAEDCSLVFNQVGHFECRWIKLKINLTESVFTRGLEGGVMELPVAHGEGQLIFKNQEKLKTLKKEKLAVFQYCDEDGKIAEDFPFNPNGSIESIAGMCDLSGRILGMMPHPERFVLKTQHPNWRRKEEQFIPHGLAIFQNAVDYFL